MLYDTVSLLPGTKIENFAVADGTSFPDAVAVGQLFYRTDLNSLFVFGDGSWNQVGASQVYDIALTVEGRPSANTTLFVFVAPRAFVLPTNFVGSVARSIDAAAASSIFTIAKNSSSVGTIDFAEGQSQGIFAGAGASFAVGDVLSMTSPSQQDSSLSDIGITLLALL